MIITNHAGIPDPIVRSIRQGWYGGAGVDHFCSATDLNKSPKMFVLEKRHADELEEDAADMIWSLMGSAMHAVLEKSETGNSLNEERLFATIDGKTISGGIDLYEHETISDFKFTSVWNYIYRSSLKSWTQQLNVYAHLYRTAGFPVNRLQIICVFRDWSRTKYRFEKHYPPQVKTVPIELWEPQRTESFIREKLTAFTDALNQPDDAIPACSHEDRWQQPDRYAVMPPCKKRALRLFDTPEEARAFIADHKQRDTLTIEKRVSDPVRCRDYCRVNRYCHFWREQSAKDAS